MMGFKAQKRKPDLCNPTLIGLPVVLIYQISDIMSTKKESTLCIFITASTRSTLIVSNYSEIVKRKE